MKSENIEPIKYLLQYSIDPAPDKLRQMVMNKIENSDSSFSQQYKNLGWIIPLAIILFLSVLISFLLVYNEGMLNLTGIEIKISQIVYNPIPWVVLFASGFLIMFDTLLSSSYNRIAR